MLKKLRNKNSKRRNENHHIENYIFFFIPLFPYFYEALRTDITEVVTYPEGLRKI